MPKTILVLEDHSAIRGITVNLLKNAGYSVLDAVDGEDALIQLDKIEVHIIITDIYISNMDVIGFIKLIQKNTRYQRIPIIVYSAICAEVKKICHDSFKASAWLNKPTTPDKLIEIVNKLILYSDFC